MRVAILGAGPAGLYLAYLLKRARPDWEIDVYEQNSADVTFGFGLAFSKQVLAFLKAQDPNTLAAIAPALEVWSDSVLDLNGECVRIDGMDYAGIGRLRLLEILAERAYSVGVEPNYGRRIESLDELRDADLIVGADGANSIVRRAYDKEFGTAIQPLSNRFAWYGTRKRFNALGHTFLSSARGSFNAHHHPHAAHMSTFVVEVEEATFFKNGFDTMPQEEAQAICTEIFAATLGGEALISNNSIWRRFPKIRSERWSHGRAVLLGDALHTVHYSIGSGTRLAKEDAIALCNALLTHAPAIDAALGAYEAARKPAVTKFLAAAEQSAEWYEHFAEHMHLPALEFAFAYITRSGRVDLNRLRMTSPEFVARYEARTSTGCGTP
jgi:2-polyprenyl-6-methoxyphenol hydroxylase-like FAD-dependent oxidoreductase